ncbi:two-component sensor histidine kinase [Marinobacterium nitratireducens]|uniref:histidine kinase n=1 Tax=Marinobacterium nitratireducens TaxID=518897 RepID=A0A917Z8R4_9GAMM|nr:ATP-binding protein [Marinobacterium nitratireducens]GGO77826.1 two-component sensor histidine kinase [Marinobacterium nitratireducens]
MKWYRSLFWKIFLTFWLGSALIVLATVLIVGGIAERQRDADVQEVRARAVAERLMDRYERDDSRHADSDREARRHKRWPGIRLTEEVSGRVIYDGIPARGPDSKPERTLVLQSDSGRHYRLELAPRPRSRQLDRLLGLLVSVQFVLILLFSALASMLLSMLVVRPVNRLRQHARALYQGDLAARSERRLIGRGDEIGELAREFNAMADYVEQTLGASQRLMQDVSHELRAPLARMQAAAGLLEQRLGEDDSLVTRVNRECSRINRLIDEILSLSRLDTMEQGSGTFDVGAQLSEMLEDARFQAPGRELRSRIGKGLKVTGNPQLLERALGNVLSNALKHTPDEAAIDIVLERKGAQALLRVRDAGPGVEPAQLARLFEPFYRTGNGAQSDGYGLGLSIARRAVTRLGGSIEALNHPDGGLEVMIRLPLAG